MTLARGASILWAGRSAMTQNIYDEEGILRGVQPLAAVDRRPGRRARMAGPACDASRPARYEGRGSRMRLRLVLPLGARERSGATFSASTSPKKCCERARAETTTRRLPTPALTWSISNCPASSFDFAYSSLAFHYIEDVRSLMSRFIDRSLPADDWSSRSNIRFSWRRRSRNSQPNAAGRATWPLDGYLDEGPRTTDWLAKGVIKHHRTLATCINTLVEVGFAISHVDEWGPTPEHIAAHPDWADDHQRPPFLLISARR